MTDLPLKTLSGSHAAGASLAGWCIGAALWALALVFSHDGAAAVAESSGVSSKGEPTIYSLRAGTLQVEAQETDDRTEVKTLRVCAHPDNLPFSARDESGFDNRIARELARELGAQLEYTWLEPQHGVLHKPLSEHRCDVLFGLPQGYEGVLATIPYYKSHYVFMYRHDRSSPLVSLDDPALRSSRVGVQIIGDDMASTPPAHALALKGVKNVVGYFAYGERPAVARLADAIARGDLDVGVAWGPAAGYFAVRANRGLAMEPVTPPAGSAQLFERAITLGVRRNDRWLKEALDAAIERRQQAIDAILRAFHVPLVTPTSHIASAD